VAEFDPARLADKLEVRRALRDDSTVLLDSRSAQDYRGDRRNERFARHGHIPTAINRPCTEDYVQDGAVCTVREPGVLEQAYADLRGKKVYTYCSTGRSASVSYLALRAIGADVAVYDGAWLEWSSDERLPVWAGPEPGAAP
jgi:thiosulfate/3-mercaptopyruvate sulfurtransferase